MKIIKAKAKIFGKTQTHQFAIDTNGTVRAWDHIAQHYTRCHTLSQKVQNRLRKLATTQN